MTFSSFFFYFIIQSNKATLSRAEASMGFIWTFIMTSLLMMNALAILNEKRFLRRRIPIHSPFFI